MFLFIDMPSWSNFFSGGILDMLKNLFQYIITFFSTCADSLHQFYDTIGEINGYVRSWTTAFLAENHNYLFSHLSVLIGI